MKLVLTGALSVECEKDLLYLEKSLEAEYYVIKIQDRTRMKADLGTYLLDGSLKGEFVRLVMGAEELSEEERGEIIRCGLQALSGEEVEV